MLSLGRLLDVGGECYTGNRRTAGSCGHRNSPRSGTRPARCPHGTVAPMDKEQKERKPLKASLTKLDVAGRQIDRAQSPEVVQDLWRPPLHGPPGMEPDRRLRRDYPRV